MAISTSNHPQPTRAEIIEAIREPFRIPVELFGQKKTDLIGNTQEIEHLRKEYKRLTKTIVFNS